LYSPQARKKRKIASNLTVCQCIYKPTTALCRSSAIKCTLSASWHQTLALILDIIIFDIMYALHRLLPLVKAPFAFALLFPRCHLAVHKPCHWKVLRCTLLRLQSHLFAPPSSVHEVKLL